MRRELRVLADGSWKGSGTCDLTFKGGDKFSETWEEGSHLKQYPFKITGGRYNGKIELP
jgi:hypothetical protein